MHTHTQTFTLGFTVLQLTTGDLTRDDEADLDMFGRPDERHQMEFDWAHFFFTLLRGMLLSVFALGYLVSARFSWRAKLGMVGLGVINVGVVAMPIIAYQWPAAAGSESHTHARRVSFFFFVCRSFASVCICISATFRR